MESWQLLISVEHLECSMQKYFEFAKLKHNCVIWKSEAMEALM